MIRKEPDQGQGEVHGEFNEPLFAKHYAEIADTFIDTRGAAESLKKLISPTSSIFEIGIGTGYFSHFLLADGYTIIGSQFDDYMYAVLKRDHPDIQVVSHEQIETYEFDKKYDAIISHSSIFLFTRPAEEDARRFGTDLIFQSFNQNAQVSHEAFDKVMGALEPDGALYINIQPNARPTATFAEGMNFNMTKCEYDFANHRVEKVFQFVINGENKEPIEDKSYVQKWREFEQSIQARGYQAEVSKDGYWVIVRKREDESSITSDANQTKRLRRKSQDIKLISAL